MFSYFINRWSGEIISFFRLNHFWANIFLWLPVKLALLEKRIKHGSLENYLLHCDEQRIKRNET
mgnify:CR=1 FL=1